MADVRMMSPQGNYFVVAEEDVEHWEDQGYEVAPEEAEPKKKTASRKSAPKKAAKKPLEPNEGTPPTDVSSQG